MKNPLSQLMARVGWSEGRLAVRQWVAAIALVAAAVMSGSAVAQQPVAIPDAASQVEAKRLVEQVYGDLLKAKTDDDRTAAARVLVMRAAETNDVPAAKYVMYDTARSLAVEAGDTATAMDAIQGLAKSFNTPDGFVDMASIALQSLSRKARNEKQYAAVAQAGLTVAEQLIAADQQDKAMDLLTRLRNAAMRSRRPELLNTYKQMLEDMRTIREEAKRVAADLEAIKASPDDPALCLSVGKYLAIYLEDWEAALPLLVKCSDEVLAKTAKADLAGATSSKGQKLIGDGWWALSEKATKIEKRGLTQRAKHWYRLALPGATGLERGLLTMRLEPAGDVKWGDLVLKPGIRTIMKIDGDTKGAKLGPTVKEAKWEIATKPKGAEKTVELHFESYLNSAKTIELKLESHTSASSMILTINGNSNIRVNGGCTTSIRLIKGYNHFRGYISVPVRYIEDPDLNPSAKLTFTTLEGETLPITAENWFHDATK